MGFGDFRNLPGNGIMEWWNDGILVFKKMFTILKLSSIQPVAGPLIQHFIILSELQALPSGV